MEEESDRNVDNLTMLACSDWLEWRGGGGLHVLGIWNDVDYPYFRSDMPECMCLHLTSEDFEDSCLLVFSIAEVWHGLIINVALYRSSFY